MSRRPENEVRTAAAGLDLLNDASASLQEFRDDLELRVAAIRRQFAAEPLKSKCPQLI
jgi:hypothetical protein